MSKRISRRSFLKGLTVTAGGAVLAACQPEVVKETVIVEKPVEKIVQEVVKETVIVAGTPQVVEKVVEKVVTAQPAPAKPIKLRFMSFDSALEMEIFQTASDEYAATVPGLTVEVEGTPWGEYEEKVMAMVAAATPPDIIYSTDRRTLGWAVRGIVLDLRTFMETDPEFNAEDHNLGLVQHHIYQGKQYLFPADIGIIVWAYNKTMFEEQGVKTPYEYWEEDDWNWDTFLELAKTMTKDLDGDGKIDQYGFQIDPGWIGDLPGWMWANGGDIFNKDATECMLTTPESIETLQFVSDLFNVHKVLVPLGAPGEESPYSFNGGNIAMGIGHSASMQPMREQTEGFIFDYMPKATPKGKEDNPRHYAGAGAYGIFSGSNRPDLGWGLIKYLLSARVQVMRAEGIGRVPILKTETVKYFENLAGEEEPVHIEPMIYALDSSRGLNLHPSWNEIDAIRIESFDGVWREGQSVEAAAEAACEKINAILSS